MGSLKQKEDLKASPVPKPLSENEKLLDTIKKLSLPMGPEHPTNAPTSAVQAENTLRIGQILAIVKAGRPIESDSKREIYDAAIRTFGASQAETILTSAHIDSIKRLNKLVLAGGTLGESGRAIEAMLLPIDAGINSGDPIFDAYELSGRAIADLIVNARGGSAESLVRKEDKITEAIPLPLIEQPVRDLGPIHLVSSSKNESVVALNTESTPATNSMFGGQANAQEALRQLGNAYATLTNHPNDLAAQKDAAQSLYGSLKNIPEGKEIWNATTHEHFAKAMDYLSKGMLEAGLSELSQEPAFNSVYGSLNNLYVISINQRAIAILRAGITVRYEFDKNMEAFEEFIRTSREGDYQPRLLYLALGMHYEYLLMSGQLKQFQVVSGAQGTAGTIKEVGAQSITGTGSAYSLTPQLGIGASAWGAPMEIAISAQLGYQKWSMEAPKGQLNLPEKLSLGDEGIYVGLIGAEVRFPGKEARKWPVRFERFGAGVVPTVSREADKAKLQANPLAYFTVSASAQGNSLRWRAEVTPQYSYFLEQHRFGVDVRPADFTIQAGSGFTIFAGPGFKYDYNASRGIHTLDGYGTIGLKTDVGVTVDIRGGKVGEMGPDSRKSEMIAPNWYGSLNVTVTPESVINAIKKSVPKKEEGK